MLMNAQGMFDNKRRLDLFRANKFEILFLHPRVQYWSPLVADKYNPPFQSAYVCSGVLPQQIVFRNITRR